MARFGDALAALTGMEDLQSFPPTWGDDLTAAYDADILDATGPIDSANAMVAQLQAENAALSSEVQAVKAHNYELLMQVGAPDDNSDNDESGDDSEDDSEDESESDDAQRAIDDLFE